MWLAIALFIVTSVAGIGVGMAIYKIVYEARPGALRTYVIVSLAIAFGIVAAFDAVVLLALLEWFGVLPHAVS